MSEEDKKEQETSIDDFLTDEEEADPNQEYIQPNIETKLSARKRQQCRDIVREIKDFGATKNQRQLLYLIYLLALEIENMDILRLMNKAVIKSRELYNELPKLEYGSSGDGNSDDEEESVTSSHITIPK